MTRRLFPFIVVAALLAPHAARAGVSVEAFYGIARPPGADFSAATSSAANDPHLLANSLHIAGGDVILHLGALDLGAIGDGSWKNGSGSQSALGAVVGFGFGALGNGDADRSGLRLEALGEIGGHRYGNFLENASVVTSSSSSEWLAYVGLRPGIAYRFDLGGSGLVVGLWAFARWDLSSASVPVTVRTATATAPGTLKVGGSTIGAVARIGLDFWTGR